MGIDPARVESLFFEALALPPSGREVFLSRTCGQDHALREEVQSLLDADTRAARFLADPLATGDAQPADPGWVKPEERHVGERIGPYRLTRAVGSGGMGVVYLAERADGSFEQQVAVKLLHPGLHPGERARRFDVERRALARLEHPNIARMIDGGATADGQLFLVMEYVDGVPIDRYCSDHDTPVRERLDLFRRICSAVAYAHRNLIIHRDLKPGNILVNAEGQVKLLDFGIAKILAPETESLSGDPTATLFRALTPRYASPEDLRGLAPTTGSDVYSLGVILYELLTGKAPFDLEGTPIGDVARAIETGPARRPSELAAGVGTELDTVVLKALHSEPERRYASVDQLSEDLHRYLKGLPVRARPDTRRYRARKFVERNTPAVMASTVAVLVLLASGVGGAMLTLQANRARDTARVAQREAETQRTAAQQMNTLLRDMLASVDPVIAQGRDVTVMRGILDETVTRIDTELGGHPLVAADLHQTLGTTYRNLALYTQAEAQLRRSLELRSRHLGPGDSLTVTTLLLLGALQEETSDLPASEATYRMAHRQARLAHGDRHPLTARSAMHVATALQAKGEADSAEAVYREVLELQRVILPPNDEDLGATLNNYGEMLIHVRPEDAEPMLRESLAIYREFAPPLVLLHPMHNLASWLRRHRRAYDESETLFREEVAILRSHLPPSHPRLAMGLNNLAGVLEDSNQPREAEAAYREALAIQETALGPEHLDFGTTCNNLARFLRRQGSHEEADPLFRRAIHAYEAALGEDHIWVGIVLGNYAQLLEAQERWDEADRVAARSVTIRSGVWGEDHWRTAAIQGIRGACAAQRGEFATAQSMLLGSLAIVEAGVSADHEELRLALMRLERLYTVWEKPDAARPYGDRLAELDPRLP